MPTVTTNQYRKHVNAGNISLSADSFAVALMGQHVSSATEAVLKQVESWSEVSAYEVTGTSYSAVELSASTLSANSSDVVLWDGTDSTWSNVTVTPYGIAIYKISDGLVVGFVEFNNAVTAVNGTVTVSWNTNGIMNIIG